MLAMCNYANASFKQSLGIAGQGQSAHTVCVCMRVYACLCVCMRVYACMYVQC